MSKQVPRSPPSTGLAGCLVHPAAVSRAGGGSKAVIRVSLSAVAASLPSDEQPQARAPLVVFAGAVVQDREPMAVIANAVQTEIIPGAFRQQRRHLDRVVRARTQADQAGNNQVTVGGMIVILASLDTAFARVPGVVAPCLQPRARNPIARLWIEILVDPRHDVSVVEFPAV